MSILGATTTGIYAVGYQLGMVLSVLAAAFNKAWSPYLLGNKFIESSEFIIYFSLAFSFHGMYLMVTNYIFYIIDSYWIAVFSN
jgi:hypothetical protein